MPSDYYADAAPPAAAAPDTSAEPAEPAEDPSDSITAELPKAILAGKTFNPGDEVVLEVVEIREDSVLVKYATGKGDKEESPPEDTPESPSMPEEQSSPGNPGNMMY